MNNKVNDEAAHNIDKKEFLELYEEAKKEFHDRIEKGELEREYKIIR